MVRARVAVRPLRSLILRDPVPSLSCVLKLSQLCIGPTMDLVPIHVVLPLLVHYNKWLLTLQELIIQNYPQVSLYLGKLARFGPTTNITQKIILVVNQPC